MQSKQRSQRSLLVKSISKNPVFGEILEEELRDRLLMVKRGVLKDKGDQEHLLIQNAFSNRSFKVFCDMVNIVGSLEEEQVTEIVLKKLKVDKSADACEMIDDLAEFFIAEFTHFCQLHGFLKLASKPRAQVKEPPSKQKVIQQNNFFQISAPMPSQ